jgi:hypothetical protein
MSAASNRMTGPPQQRQDHAYHDSYDADRPENGNISDEADDEKNHAENDQGGSLRLVAAV